SRARVRRSGPLDCPLGCGFLRASPGQGHTTALLPESCTTRKRLRVEVGPQEAVLLHPVVNLLARHPEEQRGFRLVASRPLEGLHHEVLLEIVEFDPRFRQWKK